MNDLTPKARFLQAFEAASEAVAGKPDVRTRGKVEYELLGETGTEFKMGENEVYLSVIRATEKRQGAGSEGMAFLSRLADEFNIDIVLHACGMDKDSPSDYALVQFYKGFGFTKCGSNNAMFREAGAPAQQLVPATL